MSRKQRQSMIDREHRKVSLTRQCTLLDISRAWLYYQPTTPSAEDLELMALMDRQYLKCPASTIFASLASISFAGSPPRPGPVAGLHRCGSWGRQIPG